MSRYRLWSRIALVPVLSASLAVAGCGGEKKAERTSGGGRTSGGATKTESSGAAKSTASGEKTAIEGKGTATLKGKVTFAGSAVPASRDLTDQMKAQADKDHCLKGDTKSQEWVISADKGVANVVVFLKAPEGKYFKVPDDQRHRTDTAAMDQPFCAFIPHVMAINPTTWDPQSKKQVKTGQAFKIQNSAPINHNTACEGNGFLNPRKNIIVPAKKGDKIEALVYEPKPCREGETGKEDLLKINCDIHKWMNARVVVLDHPYYAVTDKEGNYEIKNAPADATVDVMVWHESMGDVLNKAHKETTTLKPGDNTKDFKVGG